MLCWFDRLQSYTTFALISVILVYYFFSILYFIISTSFFFSILYRSKKYPKLFRLDIIIQKTYTKLSRTDTIQFKYKIFTWHAHLIVISFHFDIRHSTFNTRHSTNICKRSQKLQNYIHSFIITLNNIECCFDRLQFYQWYLHFILYFIYENSTKQIRINTDIQHEKQQKHTRTTIRNDTSTLTRKQYSKFKHFIH
jgi:hypothetical protein